MKLIGLLITIVILAVLMVWWANLTLMGTETATNIPTAIEEQGPNQSGSGTAPLEYSKEKIDEVNRLNETRNQQIDDLSK